jgi:peptide/nickel transport system permease protein
VRVKLGLDRSLLRQFVVYMQALGRGDLGTSLTTGQRVLHELLTRLPASLELTLCAIVLAVGMALPLGVWAATHPGSWIDHASRVLTTAGVSLPTFFTDLTLVYVFYFLLGWVPAPLGRLDVFLSPPEQVTGFYLVDSLLIVTWGCSGPACDSSCCRPSPWACFPWRPLPA